MQEETENKQELKTRLINFYHQNKLKVYILLIVFFIIFTAIFLYQQKNEKKNILIAEKYIQAEIHLTSKENEKAKKIYEEIILSNNKFYSILALNTILEKNLISDKKKIINYFSIIKKTAKNTDQEDLIILKKALYHLKESDIQNGNKLLNKLINKNSSFKSIALELLKN